MAVDDLENLAGPYEFLEIIEGKPVTFHPIRWELGKAQTHPPWTAPGVLKWYEVIRIHLPTTEKPLYPHYYDIGQKTLVPQLKTVLPHARSEGVGVTIEAFGFGAKKRFSVGLETLQPA